MKIHRDRPSYGVQAAKDSPPLRGRPGKAAGGVEHLGRASWPARRRSPSQPPSPADPGHLRLPIQTLTDMDFQPTIPETDRVPAQPPIETPRAAGKMKDFLTPKAVVAALDAHIIGQDDAKRAVAVALRNRWRRQQLPEELREEVTPKNILMIGPTGCGKTEISRRLAKLADAPFVKVEATKFTEVGYVGRDVEQIA